MNDRQNKAAWAAKPLGDRTANYLAQNGHSYTPLVLLCCLGAGSLLSAFFISPDAGSNCLKDMAYLHCPPSTTQQKQAPAQISYRDRGRAYLRAGEYERAIDDLNEALRRDPRDTESLINRGDALESIGRIDEAEADYDAAIKQGDRNGDAYLMRGAMFARREILSRAAVDLTHAIDYAPKDPYAYVWRGYVYIRMGDYLAALADLDAAIGLDDENLDAWNYRAGALYRLERYSEAKPSVERAIALLGEQEGHPQLWYYRALVALRLSPGDQAVRAAARADFETAVARTVASDAFITTLCMDATLIGFLDVAQGACDRSVAGPNGGILAYSARGYLMMRLGNWRAAFEDLSKAFAADPENMSVLYMRAFTEDRLGHGEAAERDYAAAREGDRDIDRMMGGLGIVPGATGLGFVKEHEMP